MAVSKPQRCKNSDRCAGLCEVCEIYLKDNGTKYEHS